MTIRGQGDAEAAKYYKRLDAEPKFAMYLQDVKTLKSILKKDTTIILGSEMDLIKLLKGIPDISPARK
jgi:membrane protease subunit HflC